MNAVGFLRSKLLVTTILVAFAVGLAIFSLAFAYLTICGCGPVEEPSPAVGQSLKE